MFTRRPLSYSASNWFFKRSRKNFNVLTNILAAENISIFPEIWNITKLTSFANMRFLKQSKRDFEILEKMISFSDWFVLFLLWVPP